MLQYTVSDYLFMKENVEKIANTIVSSGSHFEAFVLYKVIINAINMKLDIQITIEQPEKYLDIDFLRVKYVELLKYMNEICRANDLEF